MNRLVQLPGILAVTLASTLGVAQTRSPFDEGPLVADLVNNGVAIGQAEIRLELRRGGGPREAALDGALARVRGANSLTWMAVLPTLCERGFVDCRRHAAAAQELEPLVTPEDRQYYEAALKAIRHEAWIRGLARPEIVAYLRQCLAAPDHLASDGSCSPQVAATRAVRLGLLELSGDIEAGLKAGRIAKTPTLASAMNVADALRSPEPASALRALACDAARVELKSALVSGALLREARPETERLTVEAAVEALRRLEARGEIGRLKDVVERYRELSEKTESANVASGSGLKRRSALFGYGRTLAELVGDLGDREYERDALGVPTLWDRVREVESVLVRSRQVAPEETVTIQGVENE